MRQHSDAIFQLTKVLLALAGIHYWLLNLVRKFFSCGCPCLGLQHLNRFTNCFLVHPYRL